MLRTLLNRFSKLKKIRDTNYIQLIERDYKKVRRVIKSCQCEEHLDVANRLITCFYMKYENNFLLKNLEKRYRIKKKILSKA